GDLWVLDRANTSRVLFDASHQPVANGSIAIAGPGGLAFSSTPELFVGGHFTGALYRYLFDTSGTTINNGVVTTPQLAGIAVAPFGLIALPNLACGTFLTSWGSSGSGNGQFDLPNGIALDGGDHIYVTDAPSDNGNNRVEKFDSSGNFLTAWGSLGGG